MPLWTRSKSLLNEKKPSADIRREENEREVSTTVKAFLAGVVFAVLVNSVFFMALLGYMAREFLRGLTHPHNSP